MTSLALGIGSSVTIFSFANALLFRPLPVRDVDSLVSVFTANAGGEAYGSTSYPDYADLRDRNQVLAGLAAQSFTPMAIRASDRPGVVVGQMVSWNYFSVLGIEPALGRAFLPEEDRTEGTHPVVILSHACWRRQLAARPDAVGSRVRINGFPFTVVGVAPKGFRGLHPAAAVDVWTPLHMVDRAAPFTPQFDGRIDPWLSLVGRLKPGVSAGQAEAELDRLAGVLEQEYPRLNQGKSFPVVPLGSNRLGSGPDRELNQVTALLMAVVGVVLLIASFNVANLYLARASVRRREIVLRRSLGASRRRIVRQLFTESVLLALVAGTAGLLLAVWGIGLFAALRGPSPLPIGLDLGPDSRVLGFTLLLSLLTSVVFGLVPAMRAIPTGQAGAPSYPQTFTSRATRTQSLLVGVQVALSLVLLVGAGLLLESLDNTLDVDPGFELRDGLVVNVLLGLSQYDATEGRAFQERLAERIEMLPGVVSVGAAAFIPFGDVHGRHDVQIDGYTPSPDEWMTPLRNMVDENYFETMGVRILRGRGFTDRDRGDSVPVAIVNETMAARYWPNADAVGGRIRADLGVAREVVGVVADGRYGTRLEDKQPCLYIPLTQAEYTQNLYLVLRANAPADELSAGIREAAGALDPGLPEPYVATIESYLLQSAGGQIGSALAVSIAALLATILALVGVYGVMSYVVSQQTHEFGVRLALGAAATEVVAMVLRRGMKTTLIGMAAGLVLALAVTRMITGFLYDVSPLDAQVFVVVSLALFAIALLACYVPARAAAKVDPMVVLRVE